MCMTKPIAACPICQKKVAELDPPEDVFILPDVNVYPVPGTRDAKDVVIADLQHTIRRLQRVITDAHFYMHRDGNAFKGFQLLDHMVELMGDTYK